MRKSRKTVMADTRKIIGKLAADNADNADWDALTIKIVESKRLNSADKVELIDLLVATKICSDEVKAHHGTKEIPAPADMLDIPFISGRRGF